MKLALLSAAFPPARSGEADHAFHLARHLARRNHQVHILTSAQDGIARDSNFFLHPIMHQWSSDEASSLDQFFKNKFDATLLLYTDWIYRHDPMITFAPKVAKLHSPHSRFVTLFEGVPWKKGPIHLLADSDEVIYLGGRHRHLICQMTGQFREGVIVPPCPLISLSPPDLERRNLTRASLGISSTDFLIVYFGYVYQGKGLEILLQAIALLRKRFLHLHLLVVGGMPRNTQSAIEFEEYIKNLPVELAIEERVHWFGEFLHTDYTASRLLRAADASALPYDEGAQLNNSSLAAVVAHGIPTITTQGEYRDVEFMHGENVWLCPPRNPEMLSEAIARLMNSEELRLKLGQGALSLAEKCFSWTRNVDLIVKTLERPDGLCAVNDIRRENVVDLDSNTKLYLARAARVGHTSTSSRHQNRWVIILA